MAEAKATTKAKTEKPAVDQRVVESTPMMQLAGIEPKITNSVNFLDYLKTGDKEMSNAIILFKRDGVDSKDISPVRYQAPHPDASGNYATFGFEKPGIVLMPMAAWRYFEAEILPNLGRIEQQEITFIGVDIQFTKLEQDEQEVVVYNLWDDTLLNGIAGHPKLGHLREAVNQRYGVIKNRERLIKLEPRQQASGRPTLNR